MHNFTTQSDFIKAHVDERLFIIINLFKRLRFHSKITCSDHLTIILDANDEVSCGYSETMLMTRNFILLCMALHYCVCMYVICDLPLNAVVSI